LVESDSYTPGLFSTAADRGGILRVFGGEFGAKGCILLRICFAAERLLEQERGKIGSFFVGGGGEDVGAG
jgi:hypothetical protein